MSFSNFTHDPDAVTVLVASGNQALSTGAIYSNSGDDVNVADGQLGVINWDDDAHIAKGQSLTTTNDPAGTGANTTSDIKKIRIVQGTANSADISGFGAIDAGYLEPPLVMSTVIDSSNKITFAGKAAATPLRSAFVIGDDIGNTDSFPNPADETEYVLRIGMEGVRHNKVFGTRNTDMVEATVVTPTFSTLSLTTAAQKTDWLVQNLVYNADLQSRAIKISSSPYVGNKPYIAFAIDLDGGGTGTALSAVAAGTPFNFLTRSGVTYSYTPDATFVATLTEAIANSDLLVTSEIGVVDLSTAGAQTHDAILIVALDSTTAVVTDREKRNKVRLRIGLNDNLYQAGNITSVVEASQAFSGQGQGRYFSIMYKNRPKGRVWSEQWMGYSNTFLTSPDYIDENAEYNVFIIGHGEQHYENYSNMVKNPSHTFILVPSTSGVGEATTVTSLNAVLGAWLNTATFEHKDTDAAGTDLFV